MSESTPYRVLARKYRPQRFSELIGQDAMVTTLGNAIRRDRLAHAFLLTGVRGVGKTSTARLIAKALNCIGPDGHGGPTIDPCGVCEPCVAIAEGRFIDVVEIDAASNNGVDNVREMTDSVRYSAVSARYKMYIIDEVHMMSKPAFNALLKTLEEPPAHVKFLLATTEVDKVPVTILSRCQRFDLRRIPADKLAQHFAKVVQAEGARAEPEALTLIARAAEGSARDGLSILDQAIAHADMEGGAVSASQVREMLGLSDRGAIRELLGRLLGGDAPGALAALRDQYDLGVDPVGVLRGLLESVHAVTLAKMSGVADPSQSAEEREAYGEWAARLSFAQLHRFWQLLLKGHEEAAQSAMPLEAAEMALLRIVHAAELPDPAELLKRLGSGGPVVASAAAPAPTAAPPPTSRYPTDFAELIVELRDSGKRLLAQQLHDFVGLQRYAPPELAIKPIKAMDSGFFRDLTAALKALTGSSWSVTTDDVEAQPSLLQQEQAAEEALKQAVLNTPIVKAAFEAFPEAELVSYGTAEQRSGS